MMPAPTARRRPIHFLIYSPIPCVLRTTALPSEDCEEGFMSDNIPIIDVPEVEPEAYNPNRPISGLIHAQLVHLSAAEQRLPASKRTGMNIAMLHTEGEAAAYIQKVT